ncbi:MAG: hypothetical protein PX483_16550 [Nostocales cyanobacterium LE14-WE4]|jgi:hypothetical protein|nr:hypothetical protein [Anabaena sp. 49633_E8]MCE2703688.1 hypothetical protein [Anabaena sp. 49633_E8]MDJ0502430.1 hypothetical protein [Nostocales cyanobacterium LE14-WE4]
MIIRKGFVDKNKIWEFVKSFEGKLVDERWNNKVNNSGRKCLWFGVGVELGYNCSIFKGETISKGLRIKCNELWGGEDWNSILLYRYESGCELKDHVDRDIFDNKVIVINISNDDLFGGNVEFNYDGRIEILSNGEVIEFNNKIKHGIKKVSSERWSLSVRKVLL